MKTIERDEWIELLREDIIQLGLETIYIKDKTGLALNLINSLKKEKMENPKESTLNKLGRLYLTHNRIATEEDDLPDGFIQYCRYKQGMSKIVPPSIRGRYMVIGLEEYALPNNPLYYMSDIYIGEKIVTYRMIDDGYTYNTEDFSDRLDARELTHSYHMQSRVLSFNIDFKRLGTAYMACGFIHTSYRETEPFPEFVYTALTENPKGQFFSASALLSKVSRKMKVEEGDEIPIDRLMNRTELASKIKHIPGLIDEIDKLRFPFRQITFDQNDLMKRRDQKLQDKRQKMAEKVWGQSFLEYSRD